MLDIFTMKKTDRYSKMASSVIAYVGGLLRTVFFNSKGAAVNNKHMANIFYIIGSLCFLIGTIINILKDLK